MNETNPAADRARPRKARSWVGRWAVRLFLVVVVLILLVVGVSIYLRIVGGNRLAAAIAEADRVDPGWRWDELQAKRAEVPDKENAALRVLAAVKLLPEGWPERPRTFPITEEKSLLDQIHELEPVMQLNEEQIRELRKLLKDVAPALSEARRIIGLRTGRYPFQSFEEHVASLKHLQQARQVANLLLLDAVLHAQEQKADAALESSRGVFVAGRSIGDEPGLLAMLVRIACQRVATTGMERVLAQGQPSDKAMAACQQLFEDELAQSLLVAGLRGERAYEHEVSGRLEAGDVEFLSKYGNKELGDSQRIPGVNWFANGWFQDNHAVALELSTEAVEIAKRPVEEQIERFKELDKKAKRTRSEGWPPGRYVLGTLSTPTVVKVAEAFHRSQADLRCAIVSLALERYRREHGRWPDKLEQFVPKLLTKVPVDPYDQKPLRYRQLDDGVVIYSVGADGKDDGGKIDRQKPNSPGTDLGFRLWDVARRRQPPEVPPPESNDK